VKISTENARKISLNIYVLNYFVNPYYHSWYALDLWYAFRLRHNIVGVGLGQVVREVRLCAEGRMFQLKQRQ
jgi:hypothetical protein